MTVTIVLAVSFQNLGSLESIRRGDSGVQFPASGENSIRQDADHHMRERVCFPDHWSVDFR